MTDERPINAWCRKYLETLENEREPESILDIFQEPDSDSILNIFQDHDAGDEDPNAWS